MIDLRNKDLPNSITVGGESFLIHTDYRQWLKFGELIGSNCTFNDLKFLLKDNDELWTDEMLLEMVEEFKNFFINPNSTPNSTGSYEKLVDYIEDGEYIYASFMQAYGIDLIDTDMHWHKFKALFAGLPETTKIMSIISYRGYTETNKAMAEQYKELKRIWSFKNIVDEELNNEINELFYNS